MQTKRTILLNPGPVTTTLAVKKAQVVPDICPREKEFGQLLFSISNDITRIADGNKDYVTVLFGGSGTAGLDATINSVVPLKKKILVINNGAYGERMKEIAKAYGIDVSELKFKFTEVPDLNKIEEVLKKDDKIDCVAIVHHETTTGLLNPVGKIGKLVKKYNKVFIVDAISSFGGIPFSIKELNADFLISVANKCLQGMAGIFFVVCKKNELAKTKNYPRRSYYLSLYDQYAFFKDKNEMRFTPPVQTAYALRKALDEFLEEGAVNRYKRYTENWKVLRKGVEELGFKLLLKPSEESHLLITLLYPKPKFDFQKLHDRLYEKGFTIYPGKIGETSTFRLANMGAINRNDINNFLTALKMAIEKMGVKQRV